ncbi:hypothetical protein D9M69_728450 [compost metagenome]
MNFIGFGGRCHAGVASSWAASWKSVCSAPKRAEIWTPIGRPSFETASGKLAAGMPVTFAGTVNAKESITRR